MDNLKNRLHVLDDFRDSKENDLVSLLFHRINRIIPEDQKVLSIPPTYTVQQAVNLMLPNGYSQIPVVQNSEVLGVFSFRSFAREAASMSLDECNKQKCSPGDLTVDEFLEQFKFARVTEEMEQFFDVMDVDNGVLIGSPENLIGILTPMDFLRYLNLVASPFVMLSEVELAIRALINIAFNEKQLEEAAKKCLSSAYGEEDNVPTRIEDMTFDNYKQIISHKYNWQFFQPLFGGTRPRVSGKLKEIGEIRNDLFHFKREITLEDHEKLSNHRNWLLSKVKQSMTYRKSEVDND